MTQVLLRNFLGFRPIHCFFSGRGFDLLRWFRSFSAGSLEGHQFIVRSLLSVEAVLLFSLVHREVRFREELASDWILVVDGVFPVNSLGFAAERLSGMFPWLLT